MEGKVKCTCGWSWNKSDSSKKDMYVCHECGRDNSNNMKNGGWLDQYADGGTMQEYQENYNDASVSLPEGFVGDGYNTKGRDYSPAWGGQFQTGGYLKKKIKKTERELLKEYVDPSIKKALEKAKQQGITTGIHNGPLDAIRHSSSAAAMTSALPTWTNFIPGVAPLKIAATNVAGAAHEIGSPNSWQEHASDLYNNFIGSVVGALPIPEENQHDLLIEAQKRGVLSDMGDKTPLRKRPVAPKQQMGGFVYPVNYVPQAQSGVGNISPYKQEDYLDRGWSIMSNPLTAFGYAARNEEIPGYLDRGLEGGQLTQLTDNIDNVRTTYDSASPQWMPQDIGELDSYIGNINYNYRRALENIMETREAASQSLNIQGKIARSPIGKRIQEITNGTGEPATLEEVHSLIKQFAKSLPFFLSYSPLAFAKAESFALTLTSSSSPPQYVSLAIPSGVCIFPFLYISIYSGEPVLTVLISPSGYFTLISLPPGIVSPS